jgi:hypothetical protein
LLGGITYLGNDGNPADMFAYNVKLYDSAGKQTSIRVTFDGSFIAGDPYPFAGYLQKYYLSPPPTPYQFWTILYRRAYLQLSGEPYLGIDPGVALTALTGRATNSFGLALSGFTFFGPIISTTLTPWSTFIAADISNELGSGGEVVACTFNTGSFPIGTGNLVLGHAYTVVGLTATGVMLRNPWGTLNAGGDPDLTGGEQNVPWSTFNRAIWQVFLNGPITLLPPPPPPRPLPAPTAHAVTVEQAFSGAFGSSYANIFG